MATIVFLFMIYLSISCATPNFISIHSSVLPLSSTHSESAPKWQIWSDQYPTTPMPSSEFLWNQGQALIFLTSVAAFYTTEYSLDVHHYIGCKIF